MLVEELISAGGPTLCREEKGRKWGLRMACGEGLCVRQLPASPRSRGTQCGFIQLPSPGSEGGRRMCRTTGAEQELWERRGPPGSALGPAGLREQYTGAIVLWTRLLGRDVRTFDECGKRSANIQCNQQLIPMYPLCAELVGDSSRELETSGCGLHPHESEASQQSREHRSTDNLHSDKRPTVTDMQRPGLGLLVRRGFWPLGQSSSIQSPF